MKKFIIFAASVLFATAAFAQEVPSHFKLYGFIRNYLTEDSRAVTAGTEDLYFYMPKNLNLNAAGEDLNDGYNWRFVSLTTRLGLDVSGYKFGPMAVSGKVEADFYCLNGSVPTLRLRQAFMKLNWDHVPLTLTMGQTWHPMAADMPHMNNLETGAPFNPFARAPQIALDAKAGDFTFTAAAFYLNHYLPVGPNGKSKDYYKYGLPEVYLGVAYKHGGFAAKLGVDMVNSKPYNIYNSKKANGYMTALSPFVFAQYGKGLFQIKAKAILAQSGEHLNLLSGYGVKSYDEAKNTFVYTPMRDLASFISFSYGKKYQVMCMLGYMQQLGTTEELMDPNNFFWLNTSGGSNTVAITPDYSVTQGNVMKAFRATPTMAFNFGKFTVSLEYNYTIAEFGKAGALRGKYGLYNPGDTQWVHNHRFICMTKFNF